MTVPIPSFLLFSMLLTAGLALLVLGVRDRRRAIEITPRRYFAFVAGVAFWVLLNRTGWL